MAEHEPDVGELKLHLLLAVRMAVWYLPTTFLIGVITGWGIAGYSLSEWRTQPVAVAFLVLFGTAVTVGITWTYHRSEGLMGRSWRSTEDTSDSGGQS